MGTMHEQNNLINKTWARSFVSRFWWNGKNIKCHKNHISEVLLRLLFLPNLIQYTKSFIMRSVEEDGEKNMKEWIVEWR